MRGDSSTSPIKLGASTDNEQGDKEHGRDAGRRREDPQGAGHVLTDFLLTDFYFSMEFVLLTPCSLVKIFLVGGVCLGSCVDVWLRSSVCALVLCPSPLSPTT